MPDIDLYIALAGLLVGFTVGLTGMGGGALMTPILVLFFGIPPMAAVSSDLVAAFVMKPVGSAVHLRRGTVHRKLALWLAIGSVPAAFSAVFLLRFLDQSMDVDAVVKKGLAVALLLAPAAMVAKAFITTLRSRRERREGRRASSGWSVHLTDVPVRRAATLTIGVLGGLVVGMTSVGSGSLIIVLLLLLYPRLQASQLVGTDLLQAVPLVGAAAFAHVLIGDFKLAVTLSVILGSIPGVYLGARVSSQAPGHIVRRALMVVLLASGLKLADVDTAVLGWVLLATVVVGPLGWAALRVSLGLPARVPPAARAAHAGSGPPH